MAAAAGIIAAVVAVIGAGVGAYAASESAAAQARASRRQARIAEQQAEFAQQAAAADARTREKQLDRQLAAARARFGASGVTEEGSPLLVLMESEEEAALDVARVRHGGAVAANQFGIEAVEARLRGQQARRQGTLATSGALLQGVSSGVSAYSAGGSTAGRNTMYTGATDPGY